jgi:multiple sugar transport system permease protein
MAANVTVVGARVQEPQADIETAFGAERLRKRDRRMRVLRRGSIYAMVIIGFVVFAFPLYWLVITSLAPEKDVFLFPPKLIPTTFDWQNYRDALRTFPFLSGLRNTLTIALGVQIGQLISVPLAGYAFARLRFRLRRVLFVVLISTLMIPPYVTIIPQYLIFRDLHWVGTFLPLTVPSFFGVGAAFFIFMFRQFFLSIPRDYDDAAMIDGCGRLRVFWHVILPQAKPAVAVMCIFSFIATWNDYFGPLIYLLKPSTYTLALDFYAWQMPQPPLQQQPYNHIMAIATLITLVPLAIFFFTQRYFMRGLIVSGIQG